MNTLIVELLIAALGSIAGFLVAWGTMRTRVEDMREALRHLIQWREATMPLMEAAAQSREASNDAIERIDRRIDRMEQKIDASLTRSEYEPRHIELQRQISDLKNGRSSH